MEEKSFPAPGGQEKTGRELVAALVLETEL